MPSSDCPPWPSDRSGPSRKPWWNNLQLHHASGHDRHQSSSFPFSLAASHLRRRRLCRTQTGASACRTRPMDHRNRQTLRHRRGLRCAAAQMGRGPPYNVAILGFEWSSFIERHGRRRPLLVSAIERRASRFVAGESVSPQVLLRHRRPASGSTADGGAHGPAQGSPPAASARIVRSDKIEPPTPDRGLRSSHTDHSTRSPPVDPRRCPGFSTEDSECGR